MFNYVLIVGVGIVAGLHFGVAEGLAFAAGLYVLAPYHPRDEASVETVKALRRVAEALEQANRAHK